MSRFRKIVIMIVTAGAMAVAPAASELSDTQWELLKAEKLARPRPLIINDDGVDAFAQSLWEERGVKNIPYEVFTRRMLDMIKGTKFTAVSYTPGAVGWLMSYPNQAGAGQLPDQIENDPMLYAKRFAEENQLEFFGGMRLNDIHDAYNPNGFPNAYKKAHPEYLFGTFNDRPPRGEWSGYDFTHQEIRDNFVAIVTEMMENYPVDGIDLDFYRICGFFKGSLYENRPATPQECAMMTDMIRQIRANAERIGRARRQPILLAFHLPDSPEVCRLVGLDVAGGQPGDLPGRDPQPGKAGFRLAPQRFRGRAATAAQAQHKGAACDVQMFHAGGHAAFRIPEHGARGVDILGPRRKDHLTGGGEMGVVDVARAAEGDAFAGQQGRIEGPDGIDRQHAGMEAGRHFVKGGQAVHVRRRADDRLTAGKAGDAPGQPVGPAQMAGGEADDVAAAFRAGQHRRVRGFVFQQGRYLAHGDAGGADEDMRRELPPVRPQGGVEAVARQMDDTGGGLLLAHGAGGEDAYGQIEPGRHLAGQRQSLVGKGVEGAEAVEVLRGQMIAVAVRQWRVIQAGRTFARAQGLAHEDEGLTADARRFHLRGEYVGRNFHHEVGGFHRAPILGFKQHSAIGGSENFKRVRHEQRYPAMGLVPVVFVRGENGRGIFARDYSGDFFRGGFPLAGAARGGHYSVESFAAAADFELPRKAFAAFPELGAPSGPARLVGAQGHGDILHFKAAFAH